MKQDEPKLLRVSKAAHELGLHDISNLVYRFDPNGLEEER